MNSQSEQPKRPPHTLWISLEAPEIIELKRIGIDRDGNGAVAFFHQMLVPRLHNAALIRGISLDVFLKAETDEHLPR